MTKSSPSLAAAPGDAQQGGELGAHKYVSQVDSRKMSIHVKLRLCLCGSYILLSGSLKIDRV